LPKDFNLIESVVATSAVGRKKTHDALCKEMSRIKPLTLDYQTVLLAGLHSEFFFYY
jgi:hypothetical protein